MPKAKIWPDEVSDLAKAISNADRSEDEVVDALLNIQAMHERNPSWVREWPASLSEGRKSMSGLWAPGRDGSSYVYKRGLIGMVRGILRCVDSSNVDVSASAVECLHSLCSEGREQDRIPATLLVQAGALSPLCRALSRRRDSWGLSILVYVARSVPMVMVPTIIQSGAILAALDTLDSKDVPPMEQFVALELIATLTKRAPTAVAEAGAYEAVQSVSNPVLVPKRNKIMDMLAPLLFEEDAKPNEAQ